jgi:hypothetical protein
MNEPKSNHLKIAEATAEPVRLKVNFLEVFPNGIFYVVGNTQLPVGHDCNRMGCQPAEHTIARGRLTNWQVEQMLGLPDGYLSGNSVEEKDNGTK